ncbi:MAG: hypothetical protein ABIB71_08530 [Candidatus Woesearchaeota archaeon]
MAKCLTDKKNLDSYIDQEVNVAYIDNQGNNKSIIGKLKENTNNWISLEYISSVPPKYVKLEGKNYRKLVVSIPYDASKSPGMKKGKAMILEVKNKYNDIIYKNP